MSLITVRNVSKVFRHRKPRTVLRDKLREMVAPKADKGFYAVRNVSFDVAEGEGVALIGANGAGKSTMLALVCGLAAPDEGSVTLTGSIAPILELGAGFHPDLTGRENLILNAALLGLNRRRTEECLPAILEFSEIEEFINEPLRTYSSGMVLRLAFSVAVHCDSAILVIDEVLGVGDSAFQNKCYQKITSLRDAGKTLLCVSHSAGTVKHFCDRAIWLQHGEVVMDGPAGETGDLYAKFMANPSDGLPKPAGSVLRTAVAGALPAGSAGTGRS